MLTHDSITNKTSLHLLLVPQVPPVCFSSLSAYQRNEKVRRQIVGYKFAGKKICHRRFLLFLWEVVESLYVNYFLP